MENKNLSMQHFLDSRKKAAESWNEYFSATKKAAAAVNRLNKSIEREEEEKDNFIEKLLKYNDEALCEGCELEGTFCEGSHCEWQAETYFEKEIGRTDWKYVIYGILGDEYYNLSLRRKLALLKDLK